MRNLRGDLIGISVKGDGEWTYRACRANCTYTCLASAPRHWGSAGRARVCIQRRGRSGLDFAGRTGRQRCCGLGHRPSAADETVSKRANGIREGRKKPRSRIPPLTLKSRRRFGRLWKVPSHQQRRTGTQQVAVLPSPRQKSISAISKLLQTRRWKTSKK